MARALTAAQVAIELGHRHAWFLRHRRRLEEEQGFPPPLPGCGLRWCGRAIDAWKLASAAPRLAVVGQERVEDVLIRRAARMGGADASHGV